MLLIREYEFNISDNLGLVIWINPYNVFLHQHGHLCSFGDKANIMISAVKNNSMNLMR